MPGFEAQLGLQTGLGMRVSPTVVALAELVTLSATELEAMVERELATNPALERGEPPACPVCGHAAHGSATCQAGRDRTRPPQLRPNEQGSRGQLNSIAARPSGVERLAAEAGLLVPAADRRVVAYVAADLDGRGRLDREPATLAAELGVTKERVHRAIAAIREVGPPGICARNLSECLRLQLEPIEADAGPPALLRRILDGHLEDLARGRLRAVAVAHSVTTADVAAARDLLRRLQPSAVVDDVGEEVPAARPDVVVRNGHGRLGELEVEVNDQAWRGLRVEPLYRRLASGLAPLSLTASERQHVCDQVARADDVLARLEERSTVLGRVARFAVERQRGFLRDGPAAHVPLTRAEVARELGIHESTVSRAVNGKHIQLPDGRLVPMAELFGTARSAQELLRAVVAAEGRPLSDDQLADRLSAGGHTVARRTVAKYRAWLGIPPAALR
jgi:RNA polymerase sigma-54 factor